MHKKVWVFMLLLACSLPLSGCWNRIEPEEYAWITYVGLDLVDGGQVKVDVGVMPPLSPVPTGVAPPEKLMHVFSTTGDTVFEAIRNVNDYMPKRLFWPYMQALVIGEKLARQGVEQHLDVLFRNTRARKNAWVFITQGSPDMVFEVNPQIEKNPATLIDFLVKTESGFLGKSRVIRLKDFQQELADPGVEPLVSVLGVWDAEQQKLLPPGAAVPSKSEFALNGSAVFHGDKLVGWLSPDESQFFLLAKGKMKTGLIVVPHPDNPENRAGIEIIGNKAGLEAKVEGDQIRAAVKIKITGNLGDQWFKVPGEKAQDHSEDPEFYRQLGEQLERKVKAGVESLLARSQTEFHSDILGLGDYICNRYPNDWEQIKSGWEEYYDKAAIEVDVKVNILAPNVLRSRLPKQSGGEEAGT